MATRSPVGAAALRGSEPLDSTAGAELRAIYRGAGDASRDAKRERSETATRLFLQVPPTRTGFRPADNGLVLDGRRQQIYNTTMVGAAGPLFGTLARDFADRATAAGYDIVDLHPRFDDMYNRSGERFEWPDDYHWNAGGGTRYAPTRYSRPNWQDTPSHQPK